MGVSMYFYKDNSQTNLWKQFVDQSAHMTAAIVILALLIANPTWWSAMIAGFGIGFIREISEGKSQFTLDKLKFDKWSVLDMFFWSMGGLVAWHVFS